MHERGQRFSMRVNHVLHLAGGRRLVELELRRRGVSHRPPALSAAPTMLPATSSAIPPVDADNGKWARSGIALRLGRL